MVFFYKYCNIPPSTFVKPTKTSDMKKFSQLKLTLLIMALCSVFSVFAVFAYSKAISFYAPGGENCKVENKGEMLMDVFSKQIIPTAVFR